jgi:FKBP-type peptidyl-prolyl cis-trans isomerase (trigger factor)
MSKANHSTPGAEKVKSIVARESDGNVQITFTIPFEVIKKAQDETVAEMAVNIEVPGFRKGKAPLEKAREKINPTALIEHSLSHILPRALSDAIEEHKVKVAVYPKYELISAEEGKDWQIRAITCELPEIKLGDYKKEVQGALRSSSLWTPGKGDEKKEPTKEEKENLVIKTLLEKIKFTIPKILIEEEVSSRLANLLARIEKLGLQLESYLASIGKNTETLRKEYEDQAKEAIALDLILSRVVEVENLKVEPKELESAVQVSQTANAPRSQEDLDSRIKMLEIILKKRKALDFLTSLS